MVVVVPDAWDVVALRVMRCQSMTAQMQRCLGSCELDPAMQRTGRFHCCFLLLDGE